MVRNKTMDVKTAITAITNAIITGETQIITSTDLGVLAIEIENVVNHSFDAVNKVCPWQDARASDWQRYSNPKLADWYINIALPAYRTKLIIRMWVIYAVAKLLAVRFGAVGISPNKSNNIDALAMLINQEMFNGSDSQVSTYADMMIRSSLQWPLVNSATVRSIVYELINSRIRAAEYILNNAQSLWDSYQYNRETDVMTKIKTKYKDVDQTSLKFASVLATMRCFGYNDISLYEDLSKIFNGYDYLVPRKANESTSD